MTPQTTLRRALEDMNLLGTALGGESWAAWRALLLAVMGEPLSPKELEPFRRLTERDTSPTERVSEFWAVIGRRGGKSRAIAALAVYLAGLCAYPMLRRGERGLVLCIAPDRDQAAIVLAYSLGMLEDSPILRQLIVRQTTEEIELSTGVTIAVRTASFRRLRGFTSVAAILDEIAFYYSDESANPDVEILTAVRPTLATTGGPLIAISSPHARRGVMWEAYSRHFGPDGAADILVAQAPTRETNPSLAQSVIDRAYEEDPGRAAAEYGAQFRTDLEAFVAREVIDACTDIGDFERPALKHFNYCGFIDPSGGSSDSMTMGIAHCEEGITVLDGVWELRPPFNPQDVVEEFSDRLKGYGLTRCFGDRYAGDRYAGVWVTDAFALHGISYEHADLNKSEIYGSLLPMLNSRTAAIVDNDRLRRQLLGLERRTGPGRDTIDHGRGGHDDVANAAAGALVLAKHEPAAASIAGFSRPIDYPAMGVV
jgi:hypothetical protein